MQTIGNRRGASPGNALSRTSTTAEDGFHPRPSLFRVLTFFVAFGMAEARRSWPAPTEQDGIRDG